MICTSGFVFSATLMVLHLASSSLSYPILAHEGVSTLSESRLLPAENATDCRLHSRNVTVQIKNGGGGRGGHSGGSRGDSSGGRAGRSRRNTYYHSIEQSSSAATPHMHVPTHQVYYFIGYLVLFGIFLL